jgi:hypothetical protein
VICGKLIALISTLSGVLFGLSDGVVPAPTSFHEYPNSYSIFCGQRQIIPPALSVAGQQHLLFELPEGAIQPEMNNYRNVYGCGLLLYRNGKLAIFFTLNGKLLGEL